MLYGDMPMHGMTAKQSANHIMPEQLCFVSVHDGAEYPLVYPGYTLDFPVIPHDHLTSLQGKFQLQFAPAYAGGELRSALFVSDLHDPNGWRLAQRRSLKLRCEPAFKPDESSLANVPIKVLLVCSTAICRPKYARWLETAQSLGLRVEVYPLTRCAPPSEPSSSLACSHAPHPISATSCF